MNGRNYPNSWKLSSLAVAGAKNPGNARSTITANIWISSYIAISAKLCADWKLNSPNPETNSISVINRQKDHLAVYFGDVRNEFMEKGVRRRRFPVRVLCECCSTYAKFDGKVIIECHIVYIWYFKTGRIRSCGNGFLDGIMTDSKFWFWSFDWSSLCVMPNTKWRPLRLEMTVISYFVRKYLQFTRVYHICNFIKTI